MSTIPQLIRYKAGVPFSPRLNEWIKKHLELNGIKYTVSDDAPNTFDELKERCTNDNIIVWSGGSEKTIFGDKEVNYMFRAWHDYMHLTMNEDFSPMGETRVAFAQAAMLPSDWLLERYLILCEVVGQVAYHDKHGDFVDDQVRFTQNLLQFGII